MLGTTDCPNRIQHLCHTVYTYIIFMCIVSWLMVHWLQIRVYVHAYYKCARVCFYVLCVISYHSIGTSRVEEKSSPPPIQRRRARTEGSQGLEKLRRSRKKMMKVTINMVYAILMFSEFLKELAALSMEHAIINPQLLQIEKKEDDYVLGVNNS